jgi:polyphosphate glucokinase
MVATGGKLKESLQQLRRTAKKVLVVDVGGTHVKVYATGHRPAKIDSGPAMTPKKMVEAVLRVVNGWQYDVVSLGYAGPVLDGKPLRDPANLGLGWVGFDFQKAFGCPVRIINDAAMQALGSYRGGRMLFLGLGTGLGSALIIDGALEPMELAHLPYKHEKTFEDYVGAAALKRRGKKKWIKDLFEVVAQLKNALQVEYVVLGGGNSRKITTLPPNTYLGDNENAREGGLRLWSMEREAGQSPQPRFSRTQRRSARLVRDSHPAQQRRIEHP